AFVDDKAEVLDRACPVCASLEYVLDALLAIGRAILAPRLATRALDRRQELLVEAVFLRVIVVPVLLRRRRRSKRRLHRCADARLVAVLDHGLGLSWKGLLPIERALQRPARGEMILHAFAGVVLLELGEPNANELIPFGPRQLFERVAGRLQVRR